jgi:hypothetical protein
MRFALAGLFVLLIIISLGCGIILGGPPSTVFEFRDLIIGVAGGFLFLAGLVLIGLVFSLGAADKPRSTWRVSLLALLAAAFGFFFGIAILAADMEDLSSHHAALNLRLMIYAGGMIVFALFCCLCAIISYFMAKHHNGKVPAAT